jgi:hypothetical protein
MRKTEFGISYIYVGIKPGSTGEGYVLVACGAASVTLENPANLRPI